MIPFVVPFFFGISLGKSRSLSFWFICLAQNDQPATPFGRFFPMTTMGGAQHTTTEHILCRILFLPCDNWAVAMANFGGMAGVAAMAGSRCDMPII